MLEIVIGLLVVAIALMVVVVSKLYNQKIDNSNEKNDHKDLKDSLIIIKNDLEKLNNAKQEDATKLLEKWNEQNLQLKNLFEGQKEKINTDFQKQGNQINEKLEKINQNATKILYTKDSVENLNLEIKNLRDIFTAKSKRGAFGEFQLYNLLELAFSSDERIWKKQHWYQVKGKDKQVDAMIFIEGGKNIPIDSKFPWENFKKLHDKDVQEFEKEGIEKQFLNDLKKKIDEVAEYIDEKVTTNYSIMFVPIESIYYYIIEKKYNEIYEYAFKKSVAIVSPLTLYPILQNIKATQQMIRQNKNAEKIRKDIGLLRDDFGRLFKRWDKLNKKINELEAPQDRMEKTITKLDSKFNKIAYASGYEIEEESEQEE